MKINKKVTHGLLMAACCAAMLAVVLAVATTSSGGWGVYLLLLLCPAMHLLMHRSGHGHKTPKGEPPAPAAALTADNRADNSG